MSLLVDTLADQIRQAVADGQATREDCEQALNQVFSTPTLDTAGDDNRGWDNAFPRAIADLLYDREEPECDKVIDWLAEHEWDDVLWCQINKFIDDLIQMFGSTASTDGSD